MSNEENAKKTVDAAKETAGQLISLMTSLKEKIQKYFWCYWRRSLTAYCHDDEWR